MVFSFLHWDMTALGLAPKAEYYVLYCIVSYVCMYVCIVLVWDVAKRSEVMYILASLLRFKRVTRTALFYIQKYHGFWLTVIFFPPFILASYLCCQFYETIVMPIHSPTGNEKKKFLEMHRDYSTITAVSVPMQL